MDKVLLPSPPDSTTSPLGAPGGSEPGACRVCSAVVAAGARFCSECGAPVVVPQAERRLLTVVFCDLVDSTALAEQLDPEDLRDLLVRYQACCTEAVEGAGGNVRQYLGDGVLAYFGHPQSHEDDARRAVQSALAIVRAVATLAAPAGAPRVAVRVGVHSGIALVGEVGQGHFRERLAVGDTPNVAARVQAEAGPNEVVMSADTLELVEGFFETVDLGAVRLKGLKEPRGLHRVVRETRVVRRLDAAATRGLTPFVGASGTRDLVAARWKEAEAGVSHAVLLTGEPGLGKSRHVHVVKALAQRARVIECFCSPDLLSSSLHPFLPALSDLIGLADDDDAAARFAKIEGRAEADGVGSADDLALLATLLAVAVPVGHPPVLMSAARQYQRTLELVMALLLGAAREGPVLLVVEDLHWADPSTIELMGQLIQALPTSRLLVLATARPDFTAPWVDRPGVTPLALGRLDADAARQMILTLTGGVPLPDDVVGRLVERSEGVPLYVEELTRAVLSSGDIVLEDNRFSLRGAGAEQVIPATLRGSLLGRLDRLGEGKALAQRAAIIGRTFTADMLAAVADLPASAFEASLLRLLASDIVRRDGEQYAFQHALVRDAAYDSVPKDLRRQLHRDLARSLEERFAPVVAARPELVAYHYGAAGDAARAVPHWLAAGRTALQRNALREAVTLLGSARAALAATPDSPGRVAAELDVVLLQFAALCNLQGYGTPDVEALQQRAQALSEVTDDVTRRCLSLICTSSFEISRARLRVAGERTRTLLALAEAARDDDLQLEGHLYVGIALTYRGHVDEAIPHFHEVLARYRPDAHAHHRFQFGQDPASVALSYLPILYWLRGDTERALAASRESVERAATLRHPFSESWVLSTAGWLRIFMRDFTGAAALLEECRALCAREGLATMALGVLFGYLEVEVGAPDAPARLDAAIGLSRAAGIDLLLPLAEAVLADALSARGDHEAATARIASSLAAVAVTGERYPEPEIHRRHARILARAGAPAEAVEACLVRALDCVERDGTRGWGPRIEEDLASWRAGPATADTPATP